MRFRPGGRIVHEGLDFFQLFFIEQIALFGDRKHVPPGGERVKRDAKIAKHLLAIREYVVKEKYEDMVDPGAGGTQRIAKIDLAAAIAGQVLDQQDVITLVEMALDLRVATEALRLVAHG